MKKALEEIKMEPYSWEKMKSLRSKVLYTKTGIMFKVTFPDQPRGTTLEEFRKNGYMLIHRFIDGKWTMFDRPVYEDSMRRFALRVPTNRDEMLMACAAAGIRMKPAAYLMAMMEELRMTYRIPKPPGLNLRLEAKIGRNRGVGKSGKTGESSQRESGNSRSGTKSQERPLYKRAGRTIPSR